MLKSHVFSAEELLVAMAGIRLGGVNSRIASLGLQKLAVSSPSTAVTAAGFSRLKNFGLKKVSYSRKRPFRISAADVPDFLPATWTTPNKPLGPTSYLAAEEATLIQLDALQDNDNPYPDHGVEVMYRFERFRRIVHHTSYRVLLGHTDRRILSSLFINEHCFKQRVWIGGARPGRKKFMSSPLCRELEATGMDIGLQIA